MKAAGNPAQTGGFITGADAIDAIAYAIKQTGGSTDGAKLAAVLAKLTKFQTLGGPISFTPTLPQRHRTPVPRDRGQQQRGQGARRRTPRRSSPTSTRATWRRARQPGDTPSGPDSLRADRRLPLVRGDPGARRTSTSSSRRDEIARPDRPERRRQDDARQHPDRLRPALVRAGRARRRREITRWPPHRRGRAGLARTFQHGRLFRGLTRARERRGRRARREGVAARGAAAGRPSCSACSASPRGPTTPRPCCRTATSGGSASRGRSRCGRASC